jgi:hypothetical protein
MEGWREGGREGGKERRPKKVAAVRAKESGSSFWREEERRGRGRAR